jgi:ferredoxin
MECVDFCLFGVYGLDPTETILVEQPDLCRKGCPACSRICPENAILFPQHKTPAIAGDPDAPEDLKIDLSHVFGGPGETPLDTALRERDGQLNQAGRGAPETTSGMPQQGRETVRGGKDELDDLIDRLEQLDL